MSKDLDSDDSSDTESEVRSTAETETLTTDDEDFSGTQRKIQRILQEDLKKLKR